MTIGFKGMIRKEYNDLNYLLNENLWGAFRDPSENKYNSILSVNLSHKYEYVLGPSDVVEVNLTDTDDIDNSYKIDENGMISPPDCSGHGLSWASGVRDEFRVDI